MKALLRQLSEAPGPSGFEAPARAVARGLLEGCTADVHVDALGNLIARQGRKSNGGRRVVFAAPLDEPGAAATHIDRRGRVRLSPLGALTAAAWANQRVRFLNGAVGIVGLDEPAGKDKDAAEALFVDLGCERPEDCPVKPGDVAVLDAPFLELNGRVCGRALAARAGAAVLVQALQRLNAAPPPGDERVFVFCAQDLVGQRGAAGAAYALEADLALALTALDCEPGGGPDLGRGPIVVSRAERMLPNPAAREWIARAATRAGVTLQAGILPGPSAARAFQQARFGAPAAALAIPGRYLGGANAMFDLADLDATLAVILALAEEPFPFGERIDDAA